MSRVAFRIVLGFSLAISPGFAAISFVNSPTGVAPNDSVLWSNFGGDQTVVNNTFTLTSEGGLAVSGSFTGTTGEVAVVCPVTSGTCGWDTTTGTGLDSGDSVLWAFDPTADFGNGAGSGPVTLIFPAIRGVGAYVQADTPTIGTNPFTAEIQAFNGNTLLNTFTRTSDSAGDPIFLGVVSSLLSTNVTKVVLSLTDCGTCFGGLGDFAIGPLFVSAPEPSSLLLLALGLLLIACRWRTIRRLN